MSVEDDMHAERAHRQQMQQFARDKAQATRKAGMKRDAKRGGYVEKKSTTAARLGKGLLNVIAR